MSTDFSSDELQAIVNGPSADAIIDAFKYAFPDNPRNHLEVTFHVAITKYESRPVHIRVTSIAYEDTQHNPMLMIHGHVLRGPEKKFSGSYNPRARIGLCEFTH